VGLIRAVARGRQRLEEIVSGRFTIEQIEVRQKCSVRQINLTLSMVFSRAVPGRGRNRRSTAPWHRHRGPTRCPARVVETVHEARIAPCLRYVPRNGSCAYQPCHFWRSYRLTIRSVWGVAWDGLGSFQIGGLLKGLLSARPDGRATVGGRRIGATPGRRPLF
jgi:hypothetical protein